MADYLRRVANKRARADQVNDVMRLLDDMKRQGYSEELLGEIESIWSSVSGTPQSQSRYSTPMYFPRVPSSFSDTQMRKNQAEVKFVETYLGGTAASITNPLNILLNGLSQGTDNLTRVGVDIFMTKVSIRIKQVPVVANATPLVRYNLIYDKQPNGAVPSGLTYLTTITERTLAFRDLGYKDRYISLWDEWIESTAVGSNNNQFRNITVPLNLPARYGGNTGTITDLRTGSLFLVVNSLDSTATSPGPFIATRVRYTDA